MKTESAFSGLEAAIVLIAFVVVAAVFSYVMLGAGFFATQKSQEVTYSGIKQSTSNLVIDGQLYGNANNPLNKISFDLAIPEGGQAQSMSQVSFIVTVDGVMDNGVQVFKADGTTAFTAADVLAPGDKQGIVLQLSLATLTPGHTFTIEVKPKVGASSLITKTLSTGYNKGVII